MNISLYEKFFKNFNRIIIKVGSSLLVDPHLGKIREVWMESLAQNIAALMEIEKEVLIVSSGAIALGRGSLNLMEKNLELQESQASASIGQIALAHAWQSVLAKKNVKCAQILLSPDDTETRRRHLNARATISTLLKFKVIPVINENDTVTTTEIRFGDNDRLAARVAQMTSSDLLILLSDVDGLYDSDPRINKNASHISKVDDISHKIMGMAGSANYEYASGGMVTKLEAAKITRIAGCAMIICNGEKLSPLYNLVEGGKHTLFEVNQTPLSARKSWIAAGINIVGNVTLDDGAIKALSRGSSILPAGVTNISGPFERGDLIDVLDKKGEKIASGLSAYASEEVKLIAGNKTDKIRSILGYAGRHELIHRDDLVLNQK